MTLTIRISLIVLSLTLLGWGISAERHPVQPLVPGETQTVGGYAFTEGATVDGYVRIRGELFDAYTPLTPGQVQLKDCKT